MIIIILICPKYSTLNFTPFISLVWLSYHCLTGKAKEEEDKQEAYEEEDITPTEPEDESDEEEEKSSEEDQESPKEEEPAETGGMEGTEEIEEAKEGEIEEVAKLEMETEEAEAEEAEEDEIVEPEGEGKVDPDQAETLEMEEALELEEAFMSSLESFWRIDPMFERGTSPKEEKCDDEKKIETKGADGDAQKGEEMQKDEENMTEEGETGKKSKDKKEKKSKKDKKDKDRKDATDGGDAEKNDVMKTDAPAESRKQERQKDPKNVPSERKPMKTEEKQVHREEESKIPFVEDLVSDEDEKDDESRGTFKDGGDWGQGDVGAGVCAWWGCEFQ